jgi:hypothetical protein
MDLSKKSTSIVNPSKKGESDSINTIDEAIEQIKMLKDSTFVGL